MNPMEKVYPTFKALTQEKYELHIGSNISPETILNDLKGSDCQDRMNKLATETIREGVNGVKLLAIYFGGFTGHLCLVYEDEVYDPTWNIWKMPLYNYRELLPSTIWWGILPLWCRHLIFW